MALLLLEVVAEDAEKEATLFLAFNEDLLDHFLEGHVQNEGFISGVVPCFGFSRVNGGVGVISVIQIKGIF